MPLNLTAAWLEARHNPAQLHFAATLGTASTWLNAPGGVGMDGVPLGFAGRIRGLRLYDGSTQHTAAYETAFNPGDRIALYATYVPGSGDFDIAVLLNGASIPLSLSGVPASTAVIATVTLTLEETS